MNKPKTVDAIGSAMTFPLKLTESGKVIISSGEEVIKASIINMLVFARRFFLYQFGTDLESYLQEPNDDIVVSILEHRISEQIDLFDRRVTLEDLSIIRPNDTTLSLKITLKLRNTGLTQTVTYPETNQITY